MDDAEARPEHHVAPGPVHDPAAQVAVRGEDDLPVRGDAPHHPLGVGAGADDVRMGLHSGRAVDVAHHHVVGVVLEPGAESVGRAAVGQRAAGVQVGNDDALGGVEDLGGFGHEVDAAEGDHLRVGPGGGLAELQAVAYEVGQVLDLGILVVVGEDDGVALGAQAGDLRRQVQGGIDGLQGGGGGGQRVHGFILPASLPGRKKADAAVGRSVLFHSARWYSKRNGFENAEASRTMDQD